MAISVEKLTFSGEETSEEPIHSLPCKIHFNGEANVNDFFVPNRDSSTDELSVSFRGYPLDGSIVKLPETYHGFILEEKTEDIPRSICTMNKFKSIMYWNWDKKPSKNDLFFSALDWIDLSQKVHDPIEDEKEG